MDCRKLKDAAEGIAMPEEMKARIAKNCKAQIRNAKEKNRRKNRCFVGKPAAVLGALVLCLSLSVTAVAASGKMKGYFRDLTNWQGAIVDTSYEQATDEISMDVAVDGNALTVVATFADPQMIPYKHSEKLGIAVYRIVDANGKVVKEGAAEAAEIVNGQAAVSIPLDDLAGGSYKLAVTAFVSEKKADQPLNLNGLWECTFQK